MKSRFSLASYCLGIAAFFVSGISIASANSQTTLTFGATGHTSGDTASAAVAVTAAGSSVNAIPAPYYWTVNSQPLNSTLPNPTTTFCTDLMHGIAGGKITFNITALGSTPGVSSTEAADITKLWGAYYQNAWSSPSFAGSTQSAAFQIALWKLVYEGNDSTPESNLNLNSGNFTYNVSTSDPVYSQAQTYLNALSGLSTSIFTTNFRGEQLVWLADASGGSQSQLTMIPVSPNVVTTPAPPAMILAGIGMVGLIGRSRLNRTKANLA